MNDKYVSPGHRLSDEDWAKVTARAAEVRAATAAEAAGGASGPGGIVVDLSARALASRKYFPVSGIPTQLLVLHSAECPLEAGYAISLTEWFSATVYPADPVASWQRFVDPVHRVRAVPDELGAWHASEANPLSIGWEQAGYARYTREQWLTPDGRAQLELLAFDMAEVAVRDGIPLRWLSDAEVRAVLDGGNRSIKGFCFHRQIDPETRTDPGGGYPQDLLMERIAAYVGGEPAPSTETTNPEEEEEKMYVIATDTGVGDGKVWIGDGQFRRHVPDPKILQAIQDMAGWGVLKVYKNGEVQNFPQEALGADLGASLGAIWQAVLAGQTKVELKAEDVQNLASQLKSSLAPGLASELAKRLAE